MYFYPRNKRDTERQKEVTIQNTKKLRLYTSRLNKHDDIL